MLDRFEGAFRGTKQGEVHAPNFVQSKQRAWSARIHAACGRSPGY